MANRKWNPGELLELSGDFWETCTLHATVKLEVFTCLGDGQLASAEVSNRLKTSSRDMQRLLMRWSPWDC